MIDRRCLPGTLVLLVVTIVFGFISVSLAIAGFFAIMGNLLFFRDPKRKIPDGNQPVSPADGLVVEVSECFEDRYLKEDAVRVGIFLSIFDPHVNRSPMEGEIAYLDYVPGKFLNALNKESVKVNESNWIGIERTGIKILVRQISGAIARRIHCDVSLKQSVGRGGKLGIICYGSRTECYFPKRMFKPTIQIGSRVKAGATILGDWI